MKTFLRDWQPQRILTNWGHTKWSWGGFWKDLTAVNPLGHLRYLVARKFATSNSLQASLKSNKPQKKQWITAANHGLQEDQNMKCPKSRHLVACETHEQKTGPCQNKTLPSSKVGRKDWSNGGWRAYFVGTSYIVECVVQHGVCLCCTYFPSSCLKCCFQKHPLPDLIRRLWLPPWDCLKTSRDKKEAWLNIAFSMVCHAPCLHRHSSLEGCRTAPSCPVFDGRHQGRGCSQNARMDGETGSSLGPASLWGC